jgi:murein DD-endopeptidase MepM/ murein hydrolase activator NlpD
MFKPIDGVHYETQGYGYTEYAKSTNLYPNHFHDGRDFGTNGKNLPAISIIKGKIVLAGWNGAYGNSVKVQGEDGMVRILYAHLKEVFVKVGQLVEIGEPLGLVGTTGKTSKGVATSTGVHLHLGAAEWKTLRWVSVDPIKYLSAIKPAPILIGLYKANSDSEPNVYYVNQTVKHHIPNIETFNILFKDKKWALVDSETLRRIPEGEAFPNIK